LTFRASFRSNSVFVATALVAIILVGCVEKKVESEAETQVESPHSETDDVYRAAFLIMDGTFNSELTAPYDIFHHTKFREGIKPIEVFTIASTLSPITTFEGLRLTPDYSYLGDFPSIDILIIPAAEHHLDGDLENEHLIEFIRQAGGSATYVLSLCDGAFPLAESGLLSGKTCTTFPSDRQALRDRYSELTVLDSVLWVHDGKFITSAGGAKSFEPALYMVELLYGADVANATGQGMVIDWHVEDYPHTVVSAVPN
jgi:transcriptional regulator GlxA family with amidase domain